MRELYSFWSLFRSLSAAELTWATFFLFECTVFLFQLLVIIAFLLCEVVLQTNLLGIPYQWLLHQVLPEIYPADADVRVHPYFASGLLFVSVTTLVLFFASGMYAEKIGYANRCVPSPNSSQVYPAPLELGVTMPPPH